LVEPNLGFEVLHILNGFLQHGHCVHLASTRNHALQDLEPVTDSVPSFSCCHALRIGGEPHSFAFLSTLWSLRRGSCVRWSRVSVIHCFCYKGVAVVRWEVVELDLDLVGKLVTFNTLLYREKRYELCLINDFDFDFDFWTNEKGEMWTCESAQFCFGYG